MLPKEPDISSSNATNSPHDSGPLAADYYDADRYPLHADLTVATRQLLARFLDSVDAAAERGLELGAGQSLVAALYAARGLSPGQLMLTDASAAMLAHSARWQAQGAQLVTGAVATLDAGSAPFGLVFACLGDAYNDATSWQRIAGWLRPGGRAFFSTASMELTARLDAAAAVPGHAAQVAMIEAAGLRLIRAQSVTRAMLHPRSPVIADPSLPPGTPVVTAYIAERPA